jgi:hypothetical protein
MIKFFRKIRQNLLSKGKIGKYLKYAIGEIILVVIGILIAFSINNWNQKRVLNNQSYQVLLNLKEEIVESKAELESVIDFLEDRVEKRLDFLNEIDLKLADSEKIKNISNMIFFYTESIKLPIIENRN